MATSEKGLKDYLRLPPDSDEDVSVYLDAAKSKLRAAGVPDYEANSRYDLGVYELAAMFYENRGLSASGSYQATAIPNAQKLLNSLILELRYAGNDTDSLT